MGDLEAKIAGMPEGSATLDDEVYSEALKRDRMIEPDGYRARKIREWLAADGMSHDEIKQRMSVKAAPSKGLGLG